MHFDLCPKSMIITTLIITAKFMWMLSSRGQPTYHSSAELGIFITEEWGGGCRESIDHKWWETGSLSHGHPLNECLRSDFLDGFYRCFVIMSEGDPYIIFSA